MNLKSIELGNYRVYYRNRLEFERIKQEVFRDEEYKFSARTKNPFIIDCGSHIGLSILYFKNIYPNSTILGFEPNPENFEILQQNIKNNKLEKIRVVNAALSDKEGEEFLRVSYKKNNPWTWGDTIIDNMWGDESESKKIKIKTVKLSNFINKSVDLLKLDIEGSEQRVLLEIQKKLHFVNQINFEFHGTHTSSDINNYEIIESLLQKNGFKVHSDRKSNIFAFPSFVKKLRKTSDIFSVTAIRF